MTGVAGEESSAPAPKRLVLNLFEMNCVSHITHGLWRLPDNNRERFNDIEYWIELARLLEDGGFDAVFLADVVGTYDVFRGSAETAVRQGLQIPNNDPAVVVPAMAAVTRHLGFGITFSTTYEPPFAWARRASTLDHLTAGRVGWNIVTSYLPNAARNFGLADEVEHDERFARADEYLDVLYKLWEGSWDDDAIVADRENNVFADPARIRPIDHDGTYFKVEGPHLPSPSRQRTPLLITATQSEAGTAFAGKHAEVVFTGGADRAGLAETVARLKQAAVTAGRREGDLKVITTAGVIVGRTEEEARAKLARFQELSDPEGYLAHAGLPWDPVAHPADAKLGELADSRAHGRWRRIADAEQTVGDYLAGFGDLSAHPLFAVGTPEQVADEIEIWLDDLDIDGINLLQYHTYDTARDFIELVVPVLRERGRLRSSYDERESLRDRIFGEGDRLPERHHAARYRGGANLPNRTGISDPAQLTA
ncbi:monooxygenase [Nocardioides sp. Root190]|uniref:NtaA/DmoA family FMN-dependent monooxygenase n=1 Tax=Nocardioides sp. Root190 TaxID=1736488 RepID=UPI000701041A|nr:NtaA/DmoA family FMN-dependent monooxygenase [Nocardioides sp. Root190]KRB73338.1 monooxygenase [Nocardioides sp. Root190]